MDKETLDQVFEPFFSTKGERGTGLGLATVYGIVKQHGGNIWKYSEPGEGAIFTIYLPVTETSHVAGKPVPENPTELTGMETILLVEDNEQVRHLAEAILKRQGYTVLVEEDSEGALETLASYGGFVHLLADRRGHARNERKGAI